MWEVVVNNYRKGMHGYFKWDIPLLPSGYMEGFPSFHIIYWKLQGELSFLI